MTRFASGKRGFRSKPGAVRCGAGYFFDFRDRRQFDITDTVAISKGNDTAANPRLDASGPSLLAPMMAIAGPFVGTVLDTDLFSAPVNTALDCGMVGGNTAWLEELMTGLIQPVRDEQDRRLAALRTARPKELRAQILEIERARKAFIGNNPVRNRSATASFDLKIRELQNGLCPAVIIENLPPGSLIKASSQSGGSLVALFSSMTVESLLDARTRGDLDLSFLADAWRGKTSEMGFLREIKMTTPIRPVVSGLFTLKEATVSRLACSSAPAVRDFFDRLILLAPIHSSRQFSLESNGMPVMLRSWQSLLTRLIGSWDPARMRRLTLVRTARTLLSEYGKEVDGFGEGRLSRQAPKLAAKFAQVLHVWTADLADAIDDRTMRTAIGITRRLIRESEATVNACVSADPITHLDPEEAEMLAKLRQSGAISQRLLQRSYRKISKEELEAILDRLIRKGHARRRDDGLIEAI